MNSYYHLPGGPVLALDTDTPFPALHHALEQPNGLLAIGNVLSAQRLLQAYKLGIFPWFSKGEPVLWWSPDPRMVLYPQELKVSNSLAKRLRKDDYQIRVNTAFAEVIQACGQTLRANPDGTYHNDTWIGDEIMHSYTELHRLGYAHSFETWLDGKLVGGLYGVAIGRMFYGESMFHRVTDASKIAFVSCVRHLQKQGFGMIDCQMKTQHLASFGAREIARKEFAIILSELIHLDGVI